MHDDQDFPVLSAAALRALREDEPSAGEIDAAYRRFSGRRRRHSPRILVARWAIAGLVAGLGVAFAADAVVERAQAPMPAPLPSTRAPRAPEKSGRTAAAQPSPSESVETPEELPAPRTQNSGAAVSNPPSGAPLELQDEPGAANGAAWARAAEGLRNNDVKETQSALSVLENAGSASDREAARLVRAQLMLHQGDSAGARAVLSDLAANAQSPSVRAKARALRDRITPSTNSPLNSGPSGT